MRRAHDDDDEDDVDDDDDAYNEMRPDLSVTMTRCVKNDFLPTPEKCHYMFNLR